MIGKLESMLAARNIKFTKQIYDRTRSNMPFASLTKNIRNEGNKHQNNTRVVAETVRHEST